MVKAYSYIRFSTADQLKGDSTRRQVENSEKFIKSQGWELVDRIDDQGISAFRGKNYEVGKLGKFIDLVELGRIEKGSYLVIESLDRLTRQNVATAIGYLSQIINSGINIVTLSDKQFYTKESLEQNGYNLIIAAITLLRSHEESQMKSNRLSAAWEQKRSNLRKGIPSKQNLPKWLEFGDANGKIEIIPERRALIEEIFTLSINGWGAYSIAKKINSDGITTWGRSKYWQESYIKKILQNRAVLGEFQPMTSSFDGHVKKRIPSGPPTFNYLPKIIDEAVFEEAQSASIKRKSNSKGRKGTKFPNLFSGILKCAKCGSGIRYINKGPPPKGGTYLRCSNAVLTKQCDALNVKYDTIEAMVLTIIRNINFDNVVKGSEWEGQLLKLKHNIIDTKKRIAANIDKQKNLSEAISLLGVNDVIVSDLKILEAEKLTLKENLELNIQQITKLEVGAYTDPNILIEKLRDPNISELELTSLRKRISAELRKYVERIRLSSALPYDDEQEENTKELQNRIKVEIYVDYLDGTWQYYNNENKIHFEVGSEGDRATLLGNITDLEKYTKLKLDEIKFERSKFKRSNSVFDNFKPK